jgi:hypothetical protein
MRRALQEGHTPRPLQEKATNRSADARVAADAGEAVGEDAAAEVGAEVLLDPLRDAGAIGVGRGGVGEEGLEVVLDERVEGRGGGITAAVDGGEAVRPRRCRRLREGTAGRGPAGAGRLGCGHADDGAARAGATEWRDGSGRGHPRVLVERGSKVASARSPVPD